MPHKNILHMLTPLKHISPFDVNTHGARRGI